MTCNTRLQNYFFCHVQLSLIFSTWSSEPNSHKQLSRESTCLQFLLFVMSVLHLPFYRLAIISMKRKPVLWKKIKCHFLHGRKTFAIALKRDKHFASFQSSPKINCMLITRLISIRFLSPVSTVSARRESRAAKASSTIKTFSRNYLRITCQVFRFSSSSKL